MPEIQKVSVALTGEQVMTLKNAVESGEYATTSEIVREALRDWQRKRELHGEDVQRLRQLWADGKQSGPAAPADRIYTAIEGRVDLLRGFSRMGPRRPEIAPTARMLVEGSYLVLYELHPDTEEGPIEGVEIVRVVDGRRELSGLF